MKIKRRKRGIAFPVTDTFEPGVRGKIGAGGFAQSQIDAPEQAAVVLQVGRAQFGIPGQGRKRFARCHERLFAPVAGGRGKHEGHGMGPVDPHRAAFVVQLAALEARRETAREAQAGRFAGFMMADTEPPGEHELVRAVAHALGVLRAGQRNAAGDRGRFIGFDAHHDHVVGRRGEHVSRVRHAVHGVPRRGHAGIEVEAPAVAGGLPGRGKRQDKVAQGLIRLDPLRLAHHVLGKGGGFGVLALEQQAAHFRQDFQRFRIGGVARVALPHGLFVELDAFVAGASEHHRAEASVADGQGLGPFLRGLRVPQTPRVVGRQPGLRGRQRR